MRAFIDLLRHAAAVLSRFAEPPSGGALQWDGTKYAAAGRPAYDPYAAKWWATLTAISEVVGGQDTPLSARQKAYLDRLLFGGMGSLSDFALDENQLGAEARTANQELSNVRRALFESFQALP